MSKVYLYKKHPDHNLGGENYPNFRNTTDKNNYLTAFVSSTEYQSNVVLTRSSFDTASVTLKAVANLPVNL